MQWRQITIFLICSFTLISCSSTQQAYLNNIKLLFDSDSDVRLTDEQVITSNVDLIYVIHGDRPQATMALAFIENGLYKWVSYDNAMLVTQNGMLTKTIGFDDNLTNTVFASDAGSLVFSAGSKLGSIDRYIDVNHQRFGDAVTSVFSDAGKGMIKIHNSEIQVFEIKETVTYHSSETGQFSWVNTYWFDRTSNQLLKSEQKQVPEMDVMSITYVSRALRLLEDNN